MRLSRALPEFRPRENEGEDAMKVQTTKTVRSNWKPADAFWAAFQILDPGGIHALAWQTETCSAWFNVQASALRDASVRSRDELLEKRKAMACLGLTKVILHLQNSRTNDPPINDIRRQLVKYVQAPKEDFDPDHRHPLIDALIELLPGRWAEDTDPSV